MSSPNLPNKPKKELSNELRMVIAFGLMGLILVGSPYLYRLFGIAPPAAPKSQVSKTDTGRTDAMKSDVQAEKAQPLATDTATTGNGAAPDAATAGAVAAASESE